LKKLNKEIQVQPTKLDYAYRYASLGWSVLPIYSNKKNPASRHGVHDATTNFQQIGEWWTQNPNYNIGIATGKKSGIVVFDIDPRNGGEESWEQWIAENGEPPEGIVQLTAGGGIHYVAKYQDGIKSSKLADGIDLLSDGRLFIVSPSEIDGRKYEWEVSGDPFEGAKPFEIPGRWMTAIETTAKIRSSKLGDEPITSNRNDAITAIAGAMRNLGMTAVEMLPTLLALNDSRCSIPLPESEIRQIAQGIERYEPDSDIMQDVATGTEAAIELLNSTRDFYLTKATSFLEQPAPLAWAIKGWLPANGLSMIYGESGAGKTFITLDMACCVACGLDWHGFKTKPGVVVYLCGEGNYGLKQRIAAWSKRYGITDLDNLIVSNRAFDLNMRTEEGIVKAVKELTDRDVSLVIIDTLNNHMDGDENLAKDTRKLVNACKQLIFDLRCAVALNHHVGHGVEAKMRARGSSAWKASLDSSILVSQKNDVITIENTKMKDAKISEPVYGELCEVELDWRNEDGEPEQSAVFGLTDARPEPKRESTVVNHLKTFSEAWRASGGELIGDRPYISRAAFREFLIGMGHTTDNAKKMLQQASNRMVGGLLLAGIIAPESHGWVVIDENFISQLMLAN
jgi:hypothetical protein